MSDARPGPRLLRARAPRLEALRSAARLCTTPTPTEEAPALADALGLEALLVKRDDLTSPVYGGTKTRALEILLGQALQAGARGVLTLGATGSHHALATCVHAAGLGLATRVVLFPQPEGPEIALTKETLERLGTERIEASSWPAVGLAWWRALRRPLAGERPFVIPAGAASALGVLGAAEGALELAEAIADGRVPRPGSVWVPAGSCGTAAGLLLGLALGGLRIPLFAVRVAPRVVARPGQVRRLARAARARLIEGGLEEAPRLGPLQWISSAAGPGYARASAEGTRAVEAVARSAAFRAETTYTGKALAALARTAPEGGGPPLFWNTYSSCDPAPASTPDPPSVS